MAFTLGSTLLYSDASNLVPGVSDLVANQFFFFLFSAVFASFALSIMRAKRLPLPRSALLRLDASSSVPGVGDLVLDGQIDSKYYPARSFHPSWSFYVGWIGVSTCLLSSVCVYTLSRLMRYPPFLKVA